MSVNVAVPNFRLPKRLVSWMQINGIRERIPSSEKVFFKEQIDISVRAWGLVGYAKLVGKLPVDMEDVIAQCPEACIGYAESVNRTDFPVRLINSCGEHVKFIIKMASVLGRRLEHLEHKIETPEEYISYASGIGLRVSELEDRILFSGNQTGRSESCRRLIERFSGNGYGQLPDVSPAHEPRVKELLKESPETVLLYMDWLYRRGLRLPEEYYGVFAGNGDHLSKLAEHIRKRLPLELELTWEGARQELVNYCCRYVKGRLPERLEVRLLGDAQACYNYAFNVIRGFSPIRLPDNLHAFMVLSERSDSTQRYVAECERIAEFQKNYEDTGTN